MPKFIVILADRFVGGELQPSQTAGRMVLEDFRRRDVRKVVPLLPHVLVFECEGDRKTAQSLVLSLVSPLTQVILFQIDGSYEAAGIPLEKIQELQSLFGLS